MNKVMFLTTTLIAIIIFVLYRSYKAYIKLDARISELEKQLSQKTNSIDYSSNLHTVSNEKPSFVNSDSIQNNGIIPANSIKFTAKISDWIKENTFMKIGAFFLLTSTGLFLGYAFANNWIGETGRIIIGLIIGITVMFAGFYDTFKFNKARGGTIFTLGIAIIVLTVSIAKWYYSMFPINVAFLLMIAPVIFGAFVAYRLSIFAIALFNLIFALFIPSVVDMHTENPVFLFVYLSIIIASIALVLWNKRWFSLLSPVVFAVFLYTKTGLLANSINLAFAMLITILFLLTTVFLVFLRYDFSSILKSKNNLLLSDNIGSGGVGHLLFTLYFGTIWISNTVSSNSFLKDWYTLILLFWSIILFSAGFILFKIFNKGKDIFMVFFYAALILLGLATIKEFAGDMILAVLALEFTIIIIGVAYILRSARITSRMTFFMTIPALIAVPNLLSLGANISYISQSAISLYIFVSLLPVLGLSLLFIFKDRYSEIKAIQRFIWGLFIFFSIGLVWRWFSRPVALVIYTITGLVFYFNNHPRLHEMLYRFGQFLLGGVVAHILIIDVWKLSTIQKIIVFAVVGIALILTAFKKRNE